MQLLLFRLVETPALTPGVDRGDEDDGTPEFDVPIIDADGSIIDIEVKKSGHRYRSVPFISIDSNVGFGAIVEPILNSNGYLSRVRVVRGGQGYQGKTRPTNVVCQLVGFTMTNVGGLYDTAPTVYVDGKSDIARAILSPQGYVEEIQLLEGGQSYNEVPEVIITGGGEASVLKQKQIYNVYLLKNLNSSCKVLLEILLTMWIAPNVKTKTSR